MVPQEGTQVIKNCQAPICQQLQPRLLLTQLFPAFSRAVCAQLAVTTIRTDLPVPRACPVTNEASQEWGLEAPKHKSEWDDLSGHPPGAQVGQGG